MTDDPTDIAQNFGDATTTYEEAGHLQQHVAAQLAQKLPLIEDGSKVLEIGCGTGFLTKHLHQKYTPNNHLIITDISRAMLQSCKAAFNGAANMDFIQMNGEKPCLEEKAIGVGASSLCVQWFNDTAKGLENLRGLLKPDGKLFISTLGPDNWPEWKKTLKSLGLPNGMIAVQDSLPGELLARESIVIQYGSALNFMRSIKNTGTHTPRANYTPLTSKELRGACHAFDERHPNGQITWDIVYRKLEF